MSKVLSLFLVVGLFISFQLVSRAETNIFARVPMQEVQSMQISEDGSWEIVYWDNTSETGCLREESCTE